MSCPGKQPLRKFIAEKILQSRGRLRLDVDASQWLNSAALLERKRAESVIHGVNGHTLVLYPREKAGELRPILCIACYTVVDKEIHINDIFFSPQISTVFASYQDMLDVLYFMLSDLHHENTMYVMFLHEFRPFIGMEPQRSMNCYSLSVQTARNIWSACMAFVRKNIRHGCSTPQFVSDYTMKEELFSQIFTSFLFLREHCSWSVAEEPWTHHPLARTTAMRLRVYAGKDPKTRVQWGSFYWIRVKRSNRIYITRMHCDPGHIDHLILLMAFIFPLTSTLFFLMPEDTLVVSSLFHDWMRYDELLLCIQYTTGLIDETGEMATEKVCNWITKGKGTAIQALEYAMQAIHIGCYSYAAYRQRMAFVKRDAKLAEWDMTGLLEQVRQYGGQCTFLMTPTVEIPIATPIEMDDFGKYAQIYTAEEYAMHKLTTLTTTLLHEVSSHLLSFRMRLFDALKQPWLGFGKKICRIAQSGIYPIRRYHFHETSLKECPSVLPWFGFWLSHIRSLHEKDYHVRLLAAGNTIEQFIEIREHLYDQLGKHPENAILSRNVMQMDRDGTVLLPRFIYRVLQLTHENNTDCFLPFLRWVESHPRIHPYLILMPADDAMIRLLSASPVGALQEFRVMGKAVQSYGAELRYALGYHYPHPALMDSLRVYMGLRFQFVSEVLELFHMMVAFADFDYNVTTMPEKFEKNMMLVDAKELEKYEFFFLVLRFHHCHESFVTPSIPVTKLRKSARGFAYFWNSVTELAQSLSMENEVLHVSELNNS